MQHGISPLEAVRVTAERVQRFADDYEREPSDANRALWRDAVEDLKRAIREARDAGCAPEVLHEAALVRPDGRFTRDQGARDVHMP